MIGFTLVSTSSLAVATFAWLTTNSKATLSSGLMTVSSPDSVVLYAYKGNPNASYEPEKEVDEVQRTFDDDFVGLTKDSDAATLNTYANFNGMYPGKSMTFAFKLENKSSASLAISKITSNDAAMEGLKGTDGEIQNRYHVAADSSTTSINVGWAFDIYVTTLEADSGYSSFVLDPSNEYTAEDFFKYGGPDVPEAYQRDTYLAGSTTNNVVTLTSPISLFSSTELDATKTTYLFFSIHFSDDSSTYYREVEGTGGTAPTVDVIPAQGDRFFRKDPSENGSSNCYSNLTFAINELLLR